MTAKKKLIEVALPLEAINKAAAREKSIRHGHPSTLHLWWARRPLAAARAVIFAQMVDDPSAHPDLFPTEKAQDQERKRLFKIIEALVQWENTTKEAVLQPARDAIWESWRRACAENADHPRAKELFDRNVLPAFHDPFAGGGALPLEAQRLGLESYASDLNPVAVLINKAMIEIPPRFAGKPPVNPKARSEGREERSESHALPGGDCLEKGHVCDTGTVSSGSTPAPGGDLRNAISNNSGSGIDSGEHRGRVDARNGQGQSAFSGDCPGIAGRNGNAADTLRGSAMVSSAGNGSPARPVGRSEPNADDHASEASQRLSSHSSALFRHSSPLFPRSYHGAQGLAEDVRYYGQWMRDEAEKRIGELYPKVQAWRDSRSGRYFGEADVEDWRKSECRGERSECGEQTARECGHPTLSSLLSTLSSHQLTVIAWLWARTVKSPNPAFANVEVPLASTFMLSTKAGKEAYVEPVIEGGRYRFAVRVGKPKDAESAKNGTKLARGANFKCLMSDAPIAPDYIKAEGKAGRMGAKLMAIVAEGERGRLYLAPTAKHEAAAAQARPGWKPDSALPDDPRNFWTVQYGLTTYGDLFTPRQLVALTTFSDLVAEGREKVRRDAMEASREWRGVRSELEPLASHSAELSPLAAGGSGATAYAEAVGVYLGFGSSRAADAWSSIVTWRNQVEASRNTFARQALPMTWDFTEVNPFSKSCGHWIGNSVEWVEKSLLHLPIQSLSGSSVQADAATQSVSAAKVISSDPPYYDNIGYADLSDFFYVWLRRALSRVFPDLFATMAVPKAQELVATPYRHGSKEKAETFFLDGMTQAMHRLAEQAHPAFPVTIYYAFKQSESGADEGTTNTGWDTFLAAVIQAGFAISGTWPMRTEKEGRTIGNGTNALASSIVLVCRPRPANAPTATRREFLTALKMELPAALGHLQAGNIAPVDLAQAAIGPGMAVYTRYSKVLDAEGQPLPVRQALALINQTLDEALAEQEGDFDADTRWALAWFEQMGFAEGEFGVAEQLSKAKNTAVGGLAEAGLIAAGKGKVRLLRPAELPADWDPEEERVKRSEKREGSTLTSHSSRLTPQWLMVHHLVRVLEAGGEGAAAQIVALLGAKADTARELCYRLYTLCERKKRAAEAMAYNALVQSWPEIVRLARQAPGAATPSTDDLFAEE